MKNLGKVLSGIVIVVLAVLGFVFVVNGNHKDTVQIYNHNPLVMKPLLLDGQVVEKLDNGTEKELKVYDLESDSYLTFVVDSGEFNNIAVGDIY